MSQWLPEYKNQPIDVQNKLMLIFTEISNADKMMN